MVSRCIAIGFLPCSMKNWQNIERALAVNRTFFYSWLFSERRVALNSTLFDYARTLVRVAAEGEVENDKRLREYTDAALPGLRQRTLAARPISNELEILKLTFSLEKMREWLGPDDAFVHLVLDGSSPENLARELVQGSQLA